MMKLYQIADINLKIDSLQMNNWRKFEIDRFKKPVFEISVYNFETTSNGMLKIPLDQMQFMLVNEGGSLLSDAVWSKGKLVCQGDKEKIEYLILQMFYANAVQRKTILFHSSLVEFEKKGFMFLGPSGIGKTTQAELWNKYCNALIINGDAVFVQETPEAFLGWGTPWHGSSPYCENTSVPLKAMIVLKQAPENSIRELTGFEKVSAVSNNVFYPRWLENGMELCLETLDHLLSRIPVYELSCRPDEEAVKLTEETIFGSGSVSD